MSVHDNGERFPIISYFGELKQKVITGYVTPSYAPQVVDILSFFTKTAGSSTQPSTDSFIITAICLKAVCRVDATTLTAAQLSPVWPNPIRRYLSTPSIRVLGGTVAGLPTVVPPFLTNPVLSYPDSPLIESPFSSAGTVGICHGNGTITMRVQTTLTGPTTTADVTVLTYVKAGKDFQFAGPRHMGTGLTTRDPLGVIQSSEVENISQSNSDLDVHVGLITTGEVIASMRPLCHRTHFQMSQFAGIRPGASVGMVYARNHYHRIPPGPGRTIATDAYQNGNLAAPYPYNFTQNNPIDWTLNCFVGYRGSMNLHVNPIFGGANVASVSSLAISRHYTPVRSGTGFNFNGAETIPLPTAANAASGLSRAVTNFTAATGGGTSLTNPRTQAAISANLPQYWPLRFYQAFQTKRDIDPKSLTKFYDHFAVTSTFSNNVTSASATEYPVLDTYYSAGVDWSPVFFLCTPRVFITATPTASDT